MKKTLLISLFLVSFLLPALVGAQGNPTGGQPLVPCNGADCTIGKLFEMIGRVYNFIVWDIATPLATLALLVGGIMVLVSAGNPGLLAKGKEVLRWTTLGLVLVFCAWLIINFILTAIGAPGL